MNEPDPFRRAATLRFRKREGEPHKYKHESQFGEIPIPWGLSPSSDGYRIVNIDIQPEYVPREHAGRRRHLWAIFQRALG